MCAMASSTSATTAIAMQRRRYSSYQSCSAAGLTGNPAARARALPSPRTSTPASISFLHDAGNVFCRDALMHQQLFRGVAHRWTLRLGVDHDAVRHVEIRRRVDEDVAIPCSSLDHGHGGIFRNECDQPRAAARNDHVDQPASFDQFLHRLAACRNRAVRLRLRARPEPPS